MISSKRFYPAAIVSVVGLLPIACGSVEGKKAAANAPAATPASQTASPAATTTAATTPKVLIAQVALADLAQKSKVSANFASSLVSSAGIASGAAAAQAFTAGEVLKFSQASTATKSTSLALGGSYGYSSGNSYGYSSNSNNGCGWNFPIINGILGVISDVGQIVFGYGYGAGGGYANSYGSAYASSGYQNTGYANSGYANNGYTSNGQVVSVNSSGYSTNVNVGTYNTNGSAYGSNGINTGIAGTTYTGTNGQSFPFGQNTQYNNPSYVWTANGPVYNNPTYNPLPTSGVTAGTSYTTGIPGCTPAVYDQSRGWIAASTNNGIDANAPLCNGQVSQNSFGPVQGTTYTTGVTSCTPAVYESSGWVATGTAAYAGAPLCDGNVYASVTGNGGAINSQMPNFTPTFTNNGSTLAFKYASSFDSGGFRYYVYGQ